MAEDPAAGSERSRVELEELDLAIDATDDWILVAADSLYSCFWTAEASPTKDAKPQLSATRARSRATAPPDRSGFLRDTFGPGTGATSTYRSFGALLEFLRYALEGSASIKPNDSLPTPAVKGVPTETATLAALQDRLSKTANEYVLVNEARGSSTNGWNLFTDTHALLGLAELSALSTFATAKGDLRSLKLGRRHAERIDSVGGPTLTGITKALQAGHRLGREAGGRLISTDDEGHMREDEIRSFPVHDFITLSAIRGADAVRAALGDGRLDVAHRSFVRELEKSKMADAVRARILAQLGYDAAGVESRFDSGDLVFACALLDRLGIEGSVELRRAAIDILARRQGADGGWPTSRVLSHGSKSLLHIASWEYALALSYIATERLEVDDLDCVEKILPILHRSFELVRSSHVIVPRPKSDWPIATDRKQLHGWCNDHTQLEGLIESWATAIVLMFLLRYQAIMRGYRQGRVLRKHRVEQPPKPKRTVEWPDLRPVVRVASKGAEESLNRISDPTGKGELRSTLVAEYLDPTLRSVAERPGDSASLLLYGPPGTRKTTMVRSMARALGWPLLTLTPPDFLINGLEGLERTAAEVFTDLRRLRRIVVLFDECEEFFKRRAHDSEHAESRTMGAFVTAGMLPRLQDLRDKQWSIFVVAMNAEPEQLDPAAIRPGRFDFKLRVEHPCLEAQKRYVAAVAAGSSLTAARRRDALGLINSALDHVDLMEVPVHVGESGSESTGVSFRILDQGWVRAVEMLDSSRSPSAIRLSEQISSDRVSGPRDLVDG